jgi:osmotically-inducible protein OsmY
MRREFQIHHHPEGIVCTDDECLRGEIVERLRQASEVDSQKIGVDVQACKVTLTGSVPNSHTRHLIQDLVDACPGVQDIDNRIHVQRS